MLTKEEQQIVTDNHNLIYGFAKRYHLDIDEWYGILAIELCNAVKKYNSSRGSLSTYYYLRAKGVMYKEYTKSQSKKRQHDDIRLIDDMLYEPIVDTMAEDFQVKDWMGTADTELLQLKYDGFSQLEIAEMLDTTQASVSRRLKKLRKDFKERYDG